MAWDHVDSLYGALLDKEGYKRMSGQAGIMEAGAAGSDAAAHPPIMAQPVFATMPSAGLGAYALPPPERSAVSMPEAAVQAAPSAQLCASLGAFGGAQMLPGRAADEGAAAAVRAADLGAALPGCTAAWAPRRAPARMSRSGPAGVGTAGS
ncbi:hypothetical protein WJX81_004807 [Elliptochloris bilobata]|uniref:Uncharacterized protein n=1 Tax=Elliptochloris bilobata TaxID=381761 RepID=A0AAW1S9L6_9CHLO